MTSVTIGSPDLHIEDPNLIGRRWRTGVLLLILADVAFVAALLFSYFYLRGLNTQRAWLAPHQHIAAIWVGWALAGGAVATALIYRWAVGGIIAGNVTRFVTGALVATIVLLLDAIAQFVQLTSFDFGVGTSAYSSAVYTLAGANLFHLALTLFLGLAMWNRGRVRIYSQTSNWQPRIVLMWWTWMAIAAVLGAFATSFVSSTA